MFGITHKRAPRHEENIAKNRTSGGSESGKSGKQKRNLNRLQIAMAAVDLEDMANPVDTTSIEIPHLPLKSFLNKRVESELRDALWDEYKQAKRHLDTVCPHREEESQTAENRLTGNLTFSHCR